MASTKRLPKGFTTPNGSDWPMNYADHTQAEMDYAWRSPGSYMPDVKNGPRYAKRPTDVRPHAEPLDGDRVE